MLSVIIPSGGVERNKSATAERYAFRVEFIGNSWSSGNGNLRWGFMVAKCGLLPFGTQPADCGREDFHEAKDVMPDHLLMMMTDLILDRKSVV